MGLLRRVYCSLQASEAGSYHGLVGILCPELDDINNPKELQSLVLVGDVARPQFNAGLKRQSATRIGTSSFKTYCKRFSIL